MRMFNIKLKAACISIFKLTYIFLIFVLCGTKYAIAQTDRLLLSGGPIYNLSDLQWSIAGNLNGQLPNILSELAFHDIHALGYFVEIGYEPVRCISIYTSYANLSTISGTGMDMDYNQDNRSNPTFSETFVSNLGKSEGLKAGATYSFIRTTKMNASAGLAYVSHNQTFYLLGTSFDGLNSTYTPTSQGAEVSIDLTYHLFKTILIDGSIGYSSIKYKAHANWNLIDVFQHPISFRQESNGSAIKGTLGLEYFFSPTLSLKLKGGFGKLRTNTGLDTSYLNSGHTFDTQFNGAEWKDFSGTLGINFRFRVR